MSYDLNIPDVVISSGLRERLDAAYDAATRGLIGLEGAEYWSAVVKPDRELAETWHAIRRELNPPAGSVLLRLLLDAQSYRTSQVKRAEHWVAELRGEARR